MYSIYPVAQSFITYHDSRDSFFYGTIAPSPGTLCCKACNFSHNNLLVKLLHYAFHLVPVKE